MRQFTISGDPKDYIIHVANANLLDPQFLVKEYMRLVKEFDPVQRAEYLGTKQYIRSHPEEFEDGLDHCFTDVRLMMELLADKIVREFEES